MFGNRFLVYMFVVSNSVPPSHTLVVVCRTQGSSLSSMLASVRIGHEYTISYHWSPMFLNQQQLVIMFPSFLNYYKKKEYCNNYEI